MSPDRTDMRLLRAALNLTRSLDLRDALQSFVTQACMLTACPHGALAVLDT